jgi:hypothetical protein
MHRAAVAETDVVAESARFHHRAAGN